MRLTVLFEPRPWIKRRACSRSRTVAPVLHYFRVLRGAFAPSLTKSIDKKKSNSDVVCCWKKRDILFPAHFGGTIRVSADEALYEPICDYVIYSQPVLKKLVCDNSTPFHVRSMCG